MAWTESCSNGMGFLKSIFEGGSSILSELEIRTSKVFEQIRCLEEMQGLMVSEFSPSTRDPFRSCFLDGFRFADGIGYFVGVGLLY